MSSYYAGMICGMLSAGVLLYFLKRKRDKEGTVVYDERQLIARGRGFQYAYMILIALLMLYAGFEEQTERFVSPGVIPIAILLLSGLVLFGYCLFHDAYWSFRGEKKEKRVLIFWLVMLCFRFCRAAIKYWTAGSEPTDVIRRLPCSRCCSASSFWVCFYCSVSST